MEKSILLSKGEGKELVLTVSGKELKEATYVKNGNYFKLKDDTKTFIKVFNAVLERLDTVGATNEEEELLLYGTDADYDIWIPSFTIDTKFDVFGKSIKIKSKHTLVNNEEVEVDKLTTYKEFNEKATEFLNTIKNRQEKESNECKRTSTTNTGDDKSHYTFVIDFDYGNMSLHFFKDIRHATSAGMTKLSLCKKNSMDGVYDFIKMAILKRTNDNKTFMGEELGSNKDFILTSDFITFFKNTFKSTDTSLAFWSLSTDNTNRVMYGNPTPVSTLSNPSFPSNAELFGNRSNSVNGGRYHREEERLMGHPGNHYPGTGSRLNSGLNPFRQNMFHTPTPNSRLALNNKKEIVKDILLANGIRCAMLSNNIDHTITKDPIVTVDDIIFSLQSIEVRNGRTELFKVAFSRFRSNVLIPAEELAFIMNLITKETDLIVVALDNAHLNSSKEKENNNALNTSDDITPIMESTVNIVKAFIDTKGLEVDMSSPKNGVGVYGEHTGNFTSVVEKVNKDNTNFLYIILSEQSESDKTNIGNKHYVIPVIHTSGNKIHHATKNKLYNDLRVIIPKEMFLNFV